VLVAGDGGRGEEGGGEESEAGGAQHGIVHFSGREEAISCQLGVGTDSGWAGFARVRFGAPRATWRRGGRLFSTRVAAKAGEMRVVLAKIFEEGEPRWETGSEDG
jgi:hypothetical protein